MARKKIPVRSPLELAEEIFNMVVSMPAEAHKHFWQLVIRDPRSPARARTADMLHIALKIVQDLNNEKQAANQKLSRHRRCADTRKELVQRRNKFIDSARAAGLADDEIYEHMVREHDDLMKGQRGKDGKKKLMTKANMWAKYRNPERGR